MTIQKWKEGRTLFLTVAGRLDTTTAPDLEKVVKEELPDADALEVDLKETEYLSSAGLRVLLEASKMMKEKEGGMAVRNANEQVMDIFKVTGFDRILKIL